jgi:hypothetical protein
LIEKNISSITLFNGNFAFGIDKFFPISVTNIDFTKCEKGFILENKITGTSEELDKIQDINLFGNKLVFKNLKSKIKGSLTVSLQDKLKDKRSKTKGNLEKPFIVPISSMRGHPYSKKEQTNKMWKDDFFTFLPLNSQSIESPINLPPFWFEFDTLDESNNFIKFLKTDFARMCLAFMKTDGSINYSMYVIPYMNFTQEWTDEKLYAHFNITEDEQAFIKEVIPPYYD